MSGAKKYTGLIVASIVSLMLIVTPGIADAKKKKAEAEVTVSPHFNASVYDRFAIYVENRSTSRIDDGIVRAIDDEFTRAALKLGYTVASRSDMKAIEAELNIQDSDFTESAMAKRARALNVPAIILVTVISVDVKESSSFSDKLFKSGGTPHDAIVSLSARMIDAELAEVVWIASVKDRKDIGDKINKAAQKAVPRAARKVAQTLPPR